MCVKTGPILQIGPVFASDFELLLAPEQGAHSVKDTPYGQPVTPSIRPDRVLVVRFGQCLVNHLLELLKRQRT